MCEVLAAAPQVHEVPRAGGCLYLDAKQQQPKEQGEGGERGDGRPCTWWFESVDTQRRAVHVQYCTAYGRYESASALRVAATAPLHRHGMRRPRPPMPATVGRPATLI
jgi:hypothetical protein